ncbi:MAG: hypothetical protein RLZ10_96 [Bacteroidota bacterium]|jgi:aminopeptidase N
MLSRFILLLVLTPKIVLSQISSLDVLSYHFSLRVTDEHDTVEMSEKITFNWKNTQIPPCLNLKSINKSGKGMFVRKVYSENANIQFQHNNDTLYLVGLYGAKSPAEINIEYSGVPIDGLVIGKNKYGKRTFFGDNWPNRAQNWLACHDHPSDKAKVSFSVRAPSHYKVIANGIFQSELNVSPKEKCWNYVSEIELPMKVVVVGIADFETSWPEENTVSSWVYSENKNAGFYDFDLAPSILHFFEDYIAPYEFSTLANVQSTTRFGGMENAGCIFYDENAIDGTRTSEALIAHEIAHQWFGNSATEIDWPHLWLSEGFATYFTLLYQEKVKGKEFVLKELKQDRNQIISFCRKYPNPVIDSTQKDLMKLLNANSYQKGSWILHMLRKKLGDEVFQKIIQTYYSTYRLSFASSSDFEQIAETVSGIELTEFFNQWLRTPGIPQLSIREQSKKKIFKATITQAQNKPLFNFPLQIQINFKDGTNVLETIQVSERVTFFEKKYSKKISSFVLDPNVELLFE